MAEEKTTPTTNVPSSDAKPNDASKTPATPQVQSIAPTATPTVQYEVLHDQFGVWRKGEIIDGSSMDSTGRKRAIQIGAIKRYVPPVVESDEE